MKQLSVIRIILFLSVCVIFFSGKSALSGEQKEDAVYEQSDVSSKEAPIIIDGTELFSIKARVTSFYPEDRAQLIKERVLIIAKDRSIPVDSIQLKANEDETVIEIIAGDMSISTVTTADSLVEDRPIMSVAEERKAKIQEAVQNYRDTHKIERLLLQFLKAFLLTALTIWLFYMIQKGVNYYKGPITEKELLNHYLAKIPGGRLLPVNYVKKTIDYFGLSLTVLLRLFLLYFYLSIVLGFFPWTAVYSKHLLSYVNAVFYRLGSIIGSYVPNILIIIPILFISRLLRNILRFFFDQLKNENMKITGFYPEWADITYKISMFFLITITLIVIYPYIPGTGSLAFQSVSVFFGLLLSFGSSSVVANVVAGVALTYTRSFKIGDRVKIGEHTGDISEKSLLSIRMRTIKNEDITIPNSAIINNPVVNYSSSSTDSALILHVTVTLGYSVPWQTANKLLLEAALATSGILDEPKPFVLQRQLNDFAVSYELNAYTNMPHKMAALYSEMYKNIIDILKSDGIDLNVPHIISMHESSEK